MMVTLSGPFPAAARLGEAPLWLPSQRAFLWLDLLGRRVHRFDPEKCDDRVIADGFDENLACLVRIADGRALLVTATGFLQLHPGTGAVRRIESTVGPPAGTCFNDGKVAPDGALWLGLSDIAETSPTGSLWRFGPFGMECVEQDVAVANGPAFAPDGSVAYFADSVCGQILRFDLDVSGRPVRRSVFARIPEDAGLPDGMTTDHAGHLYSAHWQGSRITVYEPSGRPADVIRLDASNITSCAFGGDDGSLLLVTSAALEEDACGTRSPHGDLFLVGGAGSGKVEPVFDLGLLPR